MSDLSTHFSHFLVQTLGEHKAHLTPLATPKQHQTTISSFTVTHTYKKIYIYLDTIFILEFKTQLICYHTCNRKFLGNSLTESTSTKSVGRFRQRSGMGFITSDMDRIDVHIIMTSLSASRNASTSLKNTLNKCKI